MHYSMPRVLLVLDETLWISISRVQCHLERNVRFLPYGPITTKTSQFVDYAPCCTNTSFQQDWISRCWKIITFSSSSLPTQSRWDHRTLNEWCLYYVDGALDTHWVHLWCMGGLEQSLKKTVFHHPRHLVPDFWIFHSCRDLVKTF